MKLKDLQIGEHFTKNRGRTVWRKDTEQGLNNRFSYCSSVDLKQTRNPSRKSKHEKLFNQDNEIIKNIICPDCEKWMKFSHELNTDWYGNLKYYRCNNCKVDFVVQNNNEPEQAAYH